MIDKLSSKLKNATSEKQRKEIIQQIYHQGVLDAYNGVEFIPSVITQDRKVKAGNGWKKEAEGVYRKHMGEYSATLKFKKDGYKFAKYTTISTNLGGGLKLIHLYGRIRRFEIIQKANSALFEVCRGDLNKIKLL